VKSLYIESRDPTFNCTALDTRLANQWYESNFPTSNVYDCIIRDSNGNDVSPLPPQVPKRPVSNSTSGVIAGCVLIVVLVAVAIWWGLRKCKPNEQTIAQRRRAREQQQARLEASGAARRESAGEGVLTEYELAQITRTNGNAGGVVRDSDQEDADRPPKYTRVGKPGEVPPVYGKSIEDMR
jgi:hypothetical protein